jgi:cell division protein FtsI (penicillin-binding protein 3)
MARRKKIINDDFFKRLTAVLAFCLIFWFVLVARLFHVQIVDRAQYVEKAKKQYIAEAELASDRGIIYDRLLEPLAVNRQTLSIGVDIRKVLEPGFAATHFSVLFGNSKENYLQQLESNKTFLWLSRRVNKEKADVLDSLKIPGTIIRKEPIRFYPKGELAAHAIGFTNIDLKGLSGVESEKNWELTGNNGLVFYTKDARGNRIIDMTKPVKKPQKGKNIILTINNTIQWVIEEELKYAVEKFAADAGVVLVTNPKSGEILASAVSPTFNPNNAGASPIGNRRNRAITDVYEPGSTFKSMVMAAVIETGSKKPDDIIFCENGKYQIYDQTVEDVFPYGWLSVAKIIKKSSNIGMSKIAMELYPETIYRYLRDFGFGLETGISLPGEASGQLKKYIKWSKYTPVALSIGYEISVTPLQMVMAYGAIANGGLLLKPKILLGIEDKIEQKKYVAKPEVIRRVITKSTAKTLTAMLEEVVYDGTGKRAFIEGLRIAGKTGTAMKYDTELKRYSEDKFVGSFVGFFPVESPQMLIYVMIDNPKVDHLGGKVAAPTFKKILQRVLRFVDIVPRSEIYYVDNEDEIKQHKYLSIPNLTNKKVDDAKAIADHFGVELVFENSGDIIKSQELVLNKNATADPQLRVKLKKLENSKGNYTFVPSVTGLGIREAMLKLSTEKLRIIVEGSGKVVRQTPEPGEKIRVGARCLIECEPAIDLAQFKSW